MPVAVLRLHILFSCVHLLRCKAYPATWSQDWVQPTEVGARRPKSGWFVYRTCCCGGKLPRVNLTSLYVSSDYNRFVPSLYVVSWRCIISVDTAFQKLFKILEMGFVQFNATLIGFPQETFNTCVVTYSMFLIYRQQRPWARIFICFERGSGLRGQSLIRARFKAVTTVLLNMCSGRVVSKDLCTFHFTMKHSKKTAWPWNRRY
jgi:hypothetical protein